MVGVSHLTNSVGVLYPAERVDFVVAWPGSVVDTDTEVIIELDKEYVRISLEALLDPCHVGHYSPAHHLTPLPPLPNLAEPPVPYFGISRILESNNGRYFLRPNFALSPTQSFLLSPSSAIRPPKSNKTEVLRFNLREEKGPLLTSPLPEVGKTFMIYTAIEILNHENSIPKGFINRTTWEPQRLPLVALDREAWDRHQLVPWTGPERVWVELTINNIDSNGHPFHLVRFSSRYEFSKTVSADIGILVARL